MLVEEIVRRAAAAYKTCSGVRAVTTSVDALLGPGARAGEIARVMEADFETLDDALAVLHVESFRPIKEAIEATGSTVLLYEHRVV